MPASINIKTQGKFGENVSDAVCPRLACPQVLFLLPEQQFKLLGAETSPILCFLYSSRHTDVMVQYK